MSPSKWRAYEISYVKFRISDRFRPLSGLCRSNDFGIFGFEINDLHWDDLRDSFLVAYLQYIYRISLVDTIPLTIQIILIRAILL